MKQRKVVQINIAANWGSTGKIAEGIGKLAIERGWISEIIYRLNSNKSNSKIFGVGNKKDFFIHFIHNRLFDSEGLASKDQTRKIIGELKREKPDIIHLHNIHGHWMNYPMLFDYLASIKTPVVWTLHDCWTFTGHCYHFEPAGCFKWREECKECPLKFKFGLDQSKRNFNLKKEHFLKIADRLTLVPVSNWLGDYLKQSFFKDCNIQVIQNGIDLDVFKPSDEVKRSRMILGVSNVWPESKGLSTFHKLRSLMPADVRIVLVGLTEKQIKSLPEGIEGMGRTSGVDELVELYSSASVFVNPTLQDTFPTVNLEALACGTPVVTYRTGGSPETLDAKTGIVVEKGSAQAMALAIMEILDGKEALRSDDCRKRADACFNQKVQFGKYVDLYEDILASNQ